MKNLRYTILILLAMSLYSRQTYSQTWTGTELVLNHNTLGGNGDYTALYRADTQNDKSVLRVSMGDEHISDFQIGYTRWQDGVWNTTFNLDGLGNGYYQGRLGVGISQPSQSFDVLGRIKLRSNGSGSSGIWFTGIDGNESAFLGQFANSSSDALGVWHGGDWRFLITNNGYVGIGTTNPTQKLTVNGTVYSTEVKVDVNAGTGPDYVFEPSYQLPSLTEIENYIKANKHLPEVPSAKEMETNGINLSEMNMLLLKKVEELTLHLIEANKKIEYLTKRIDEKN